MLQVIHCTNCTEKGNLTLKVGLVVEAESCSTCHHLNETTWDYWFCDVICLGEWLRIREIEELGVPCQDCRETGFAFGFEVNGECKTCKGKKRVG